MASTPTSAVSSAVSSSSSASSSSLRRDRTPVSAPASRERDSPSPAFSLSVQDFASGAAARTLGWMANMKEQWESGNRIFRPAQVYTGPAPREYLPLAKR